MRLLSNNPFLFIFCLLSSSIGAAVLVGWILDNPLLIQITPLFVPMQANTAIGFLVSGIGMILLAYRKKIFVACTGLIVFLLGFLTLIQYLFDIDLNIDQIFINHTITTKTSHPGRMAPNTALTFTFVGFALFLSSISLFNSIRQFLVKLIVSLIIFFGTISLVGYLISVESLYGWKNYTRMAFHTSIGFIIIGMGFYLNEFITKTNKNFNQSRLWISVLPTIISISISFILWHTLTMQEEKLVKSSLNQEGEYTKQNLSLIMNFNFLAMKRMANRWNARGETPENEWYNDANKYLQDQPGLKAVIWVDHTLTRQWAVSKFPTSFQSVFDSFIKKNIKTPTTSTTALQLPMKKNNLIVLALPIQKEDAFDGFLLSVYDLEEIVQLVVPKELITNSQITLSSEKMIIIDLTNPHTEYSTKWLIVKNFSVLSQEWTLTISPSKKALNEMISILPKIILAIGILLGIMLAIIIELAKTAQTRAHKMALSEKARNKSMIALSLSKQELTKVVNELSKSNHELEQFAYVASHDLKAPLRMIYQTTMWLEEDLEEKINQNVQNHLSLIKNRINKMAKLLDDLLEYSRIGRKQSADYDKAINGMQLMNHVMDLVEIPSTFKVNISHKFEEIKIKEMPLKQIMINLINNSIKHHDKKEGKIEVNVNEEEGNYIFCVNDDGPGIPEEYHSQVFEMFRTLKPRDKVEGSGMGLAIIKKQIETQKGTIKLESEKGKGAKFIFSFPKINCGK